MGFPFDSLRILSIQMGLEFGREVWYNRKKVREGFSVERSFFSPVMREEGEEEEKDKSAWRKIIFASIEMGFRNLVFMRVSSKFV